MNARLSPEREAEIAARHEAATPGPWCTDSWEIYQGTEYVPGISQWIGETCRGNTTCEQDRADAEFVAAARTDVPALLAELAAVRAERDAWRDQRNAVFATNERLLAQVEESGQARLRAENDGRTARQEAAAAAFTAAADLVARYGAGSVEQTLCRDIVTELRGKAREVAS